MPIRDIVNHYLEKGYSLRNSQNLAAQEILLSKISSSSLSEQITLKGGIVMFNLSRNNRRVTQDIDFDFISYSIEPFSIRRFIEKLNSVKDGYHVSIRGEIEQLNQEDYKGVRVNTILSDEENYSVRIKLDIGVNAHTDINQDKLAFILDGLSSNIVLKVNSPEQIFSEKVISLSRFGIISTRYRDLYDMFFLIDEVGLNTETVRKVIITILNSSNKQPKTILDLKTIICETLANKKFESDVLKANTNWLEIDYNHLKETIKGFINTL